MPYVLAALGIATARNIVVETTDNVMIRGWHLPPANSDAIFSLHLKGQEREEYLDRILRNATRIVIFLHGNAGTRATTRRLNIINQLSSYHQTHVIAIDYRGFGDSSGWPSEEGTAEDVRAVLNWLLHRVGNYSNPSIVLYGQSLGTGISLHFLANYPNASTPVGPISGLILDAPFTSLPDASMSHWLATPFRIFPLVKRLM
jgi:abhydrolase domain-containing protein 12